MSASDEVGIAIARGQTIYTLNRHISDRVTPIFSKEDKLLTDWITLSNEGRKEKVANEKQFDPGFR